MAATAAAAGVLGSASSGWFGRLAAAAENELSGRPKSCILLWMDGGPSHIDTFDPKPDASSDIRGTLSAIDTDIPGIQICEKLPAISRLMEHAAVLRGMSTEEADHERARIYMHTVIGPDSVECNTRRSVRLCRRSWVIRSFRCRTLWSRGLHSQNTIF